MRKLSPSLMLNIIRHLIYCYTIGRSSLRFSQTSNAGRTFFIYFIIASHHSVSPFSLSIWIFPFTVFGTLIPYLCVLIQNLCVLEIIWYRFLNMYLPTMKILVLLICSSLLQIQPYGTGTNILHPSVYFKCYYHLSAEYKSSIILLC